MTPGVAAFLQRAKVEAAQFGILAVARPDAPELAVTVVEQVRLPLDALRIERQRGWPGVGKLLRSAPVLEVFAGCPEVELGRLAFAVGPRVAAPHRVKPVVEPFDRRHVIVGVVSL